MQQQLITTDKNQFIFFKKTRTKKNRIENIKKWKKGERERGMRK